MDVIEKKLKDIKPYDNNKQICAYFHIHILISVEQLRKLSMTYSAAAPFLLIYV